jgi:hypothetical protein
VTRNLGAAGVALFVAASVAGCGGGGGAGPLAWPKGAGTSVVGIPVKAGEFAVTGLDGLPAVKQRVVLLDVRPQHPKDAQGLVIRYAASNGRGMHIGGQRGWRPAEWDLARLHDFVIPPHGRAAVVIGAAAAKPGVYLVRGFIVHYRVGGTSYSAPQQVWLRVCAAVRSCPG